MAEELIITSPDGKTWTPRFSGNRDYLEDVAYGNGVFVVMGNHGDILTSTDGVTWTKSRSESRLLCLTYGKGIFVAMGRDAELTIDYSSSIAGLNNPRLPDLPVEASLTCMDTGLFVYRCICTIGLGIIGGDIPGETGSV